MREIRLAVCCPDAAALAGVAARLRRAAVESWMPGAECDAVMIAAPGPQPEELLRAGVHVLAAADPCPSPLAMEVLFNEAGRAGVLFALANPDRYLPSRQLIRKQLGIALGEPGLIRLHRWEPPGGAVEVAGLPEPLLRDLDVTLWLAGRIPDRVFAVEQKCEGAGRYLQVHLGFAHGGMAQLDYTNRLPPGEGYSSLSVIASSGAAYADDHQNAQLLYRGGPAQAVRTEERAGLLAAMAQEFVDALREGREFSANAAEWKNVFAVAEAVRQSLDTRRVVAREGVT